MRSWDSVQSEVRPQKKAPSNRRCLNCSRAYEYAALTAEPYVKERAGIHGLDAALLVHRLSWFWKNSKSYRIEPFTAATTVGAENCDRLFADENVNGDFVRKLEAFAEALDGDEDIRTSGRDGHFGAGHDACCLQLLQ